MDVRSCDLSKLSSAAILRSGRSHFEAFIWAVQNVRFTVLAAPNRTSSFRPGLVV